MSELNVTGWATTGMASGTIADDQSANVHEIGRGIMMDTVGHRLSIATYMQLQDIQERRAREMAAI